MPDQLAEYLTTGEVAARLNVPAQTVRGWVRRGVLRGRRVGRTVLVLEATLVDFEPPRRGRPPGVKEQRRRKRRA